MAKLTAKYLVDDGSHTWRANTPDLGVPVQPQSLDEMQRELLDGTVHLDPHPEQRNPLRTKDIHDPGQAKEFMRTQIAKHLEHFFASGGKKTVAAKLSADNQFPSTTVSPSRVAELRSSAKQPAKKEVRP